jgi:hypothetical protein
MSPEGPSILENVFPVLALHYPVPYQTAQTAVSDLLRQKPLPAPWEKMRVLADKENRKQNTEIDDVTMLFLHVV